MCNTDHIVSVHFSETEKTKSISKRIRQDQLGLEYLEWMEDVYSEEASDDYSSENFSDNFLEKLEELKSIQASLVQGQKEMEWRMHSLCATLARFQQIDNVSTFKSQKYN